MINDDLERLATRGPTRDPVDVVDSAIAEGASVRRFPARLAAVAVGVVLVAGLVIGLASMGNTGTPANVDAPVTIPTSTSPNGGVTATVPSSIIDDSDIDSPGTYPCGYSPTTEVRVWSSDTTDVSLIIKENDAHLIRVTDESGKVRQTCMGGESAKANLEQEMSMGWALPVDDGVLIVVMHPVGRQIIPIDELTQLGPVAAVGPSDFDLSLFFAAPDGEMPSGNPSLDNLARSIQQAFEGTTNAAPLAGTILVPETDDDVATSPTGSPQDYDAVDALIAVVEFDGEAAEVPAPYFGSQNASGGPAESLDGFVPAGQDQVFCWAVEVINSRPQPRDEYREIVVADQYLAAIQPFAVAPVAAELDALVDFTHGLVAQGSFTEGDELEQGDPVADAFRAVNTFVDQHCLGLA